LKSYLARDHQKEWNEWLERAKHIATRLSTIPTLTTEIVVDPGPANAFPSLAVDWDHQRIKTTPKEVLAALKQGNPSIVAGGHQNRLMIGVVLLRPDQVDIVAQRVKDILEHAV